MPWLQLELISTRDQAPLIEAALENGGALAVTIDDAADQPILEPAPDATPIWPRVRITALYEDDPRGGTLVRQAADILGRHSLAPALIGRLDDRPWESLWLDDFKPTRFGRRLWVCPRGQRPATVADDAVFVDLDPGLAFGTGHHPTTALCLTWLDGLDLADRTLLDYGCGSGILAIAALKLGARRAVAVDHDAQALEATEENAGGNAVAERLSITYPDAPRGELRRMLGDDGADVLVANILAGPLIELAPTLTACSAFGSLIGLSGVLADQTSRVAAAYQGAFLLQAPDFLDDWALIKGRRWSD